MADDGLLLNFQLPSDAFAPKHAFKGRLSPSLWLWPRSDMPISVDDLLSSSRVAG